MKLAVSNFYDCNPILTTVRSRKNFFELFELRDDEATLRNNAFDFLNTGLSVTDLVDFQHRAFTPHIVYTMHGLQFPDKNLGIKLPEVKKNNFLLLSKLIR